ncbi:MAG: dihydrofolate reductase [Bacteroidota bacterium]
MITIIAAAGENNALGKDNDLVWHLPDDFKRFKQLTSGHTIIMGRKTFESFPGLLPNRTHIILSRKSDYAPQGTLVVYTVEEALHCVKGHEQSFVIGGGEIYRLFLPYTEKIELTRIYHSFEADTFFPEIDEAIWRLDTSVYHPKDDRHQYDFTYLTYNRIS